MLGIHQRELPVHYKYHSAENLNGSHQNNLQKF